MNDSYLERPGARIAYSLSEGTTPTRIIAHGVTSSRAADDAGGFMPWTALDTSVRTVRFDARGHGASTGRTEPEDYGWPSLADDLLALIDEVSPDEPVDALGASMGTATILWAATRRPDRFRRLVLVIPPTAWETRAAQGAMYLQAAELVERDGADVFARMAASAPPLPALAGSGLTFPPPAVSADLLPTVLRGAAGTDFPAPELIAAIPTPALLLPWAGDPGHPVSTSEKLIDLLPDARMQVATTFADVGARPAAIEEFLRRA